MFEIPFPEVFAVIASLFDIAALLLVIFAGSQAIYKYVTLPKLKGSYSLSDKNYYTLRNRLVHRLILAIDFFIVSELIKLAFATNTEVLVEILLIVIIRSVLNMVLQRELK